MQSIFNRVEKKYVISEEQYNQLMKKIEPYIAKDKYFFNKICNIYFDTENYDLTIRSLEKPTYKEKVRVRSYGTPGNEDIIFLEIKKKYDGVVNKRRINLKLKDFNYFLDNGIMPSNVDKQISKEIIYCFNNYELQPKMFVAYDRCSYYDKDNKDFRITFDTNLRSRDYNLSLEDGDYGELYGNEKFYIMELKTLGALPLWFVRAINELKIYPTSFSKIGKIYEEKIKEEEYICLKVF